MQYKKNLQNVYLLYLHMLKSVLAGSALFKILYF